MRHFLTFSLLLLALLLPTTASAHDFEVDGIYYNIIDSNKVEVTISPNLNYSGSITIPNAVTHNGNSYSVTAIGGGAFSGCTGLTSINIPNSVTLISHNAFSCCTGLTSLIIPNSVTTIYDTAFWGCTGLTSIDISNSLTFIVHMVFYGCTGLTSINIPNSVTGIGSHAFAECTGLTTIDIPNSVTDIDDGVFADCNNLSTIVCHAATPPTMDSSAFDGATYNNATLTVPKGCLNTYQSADGWKSFSNIQEQAYDFEVDGIYYNIIDTNDVEVTISPNHNYTGSITIPDAVTYDDNSYSVTSIGEGAFSDCHSLTSIAIPNSVITIGECAFVYCSGLTSISIPNSVTTIGSGAFWFCSGLTNITIGNSLKWMNSDSFYGNENLTSISVAYDNPYLDSRDNCNAIIHTSDNMLLCGCKKTIIPNTVTVIFFSAFAGCTGLTSIDIPNSVTDICTNVFADCNNLSTIVCRATTPPTMDSSAFSEATYNNATLTVPKGCLNAYQSADGWKSFSNIQEQAYNFEVDGIYYNIIDTNEVEVTISPNHNYTGSITIPDAVTYDDNSYSVTSIGEGAFYGCTGLTNIDIPNSVTSIGDWAFGCCTGLSSIDIPNSVIDINSSTFWGCTSLTGIHIGNSLRLFPSSALGECPNLVSITVATDNPYLDSRDNCNAVIETSTNMLKSGCKTTVIPNTVTVIFDYAFYGSGLTTIDIPNSVYISGSAFGECNNLTDVYSHITDLSSNPVYYDAFYLSSGDYSNRTLHVPYGTLAAYQADSNWSQYFGTIVEMDSPNFLSIPDTSVFHGDTITIPVQMNNQESIMAFQTDIFLPQGFSIVTDEDDEPLITPSSRLTSDHVIMAEQLNDGNIRVICYTPRSKVIAGNEGDLFYITVAVSEQASGDYNILLHNSLLTTTEYTELSIPDATAIINVKTYTPGDVNDSRSVNVTDIVITAQYILQRNPSPFIFDAADMNGDGNVTVTDIMLIARIIMTPAASAPKRMPTMEYTGDRLSGEGISIATGEMRSVSIALDNAIDYCAFQLDINLPEGLTASNVSLTDRAGSHALDVEAIGDGLMRVLCYSPELAAISGSEGALLTFDVTATRPVAGDITVDGIELVTTGCQTVLPETFTIAVNNMTAVTEAAASKTLDRIDYYNAAGQRLESPASGLTIIVTTYTDGSHSTSKVIK